MPHVIRAAALTGYLEVMQELGVAPVRLLKQFGISRVSLDDDDALLQMDVVCGLLEASSFATGSPDLGLRIARHQDLDVLGILGLVLTNAGTPAEATSIVSRFIFVQGTALRIDVQKTGLLIPNTVAINCIINEIAPSKQRQAVELLLGMSFKAGQMRDPFIKKIKAVSLPHRLGATVERYREFFGVPVYENQPCAALHCDAEGWNTPIADANPQVSQMIKDHLEWNFPIPNRSLADRVRVALRPLIGTPQATRENVASILAIHPRTLHRQLHSENTSFQSIKDTIRKDLILKYLIETNATLAQLSALLGFPEQSALSRACRKWFGQPPSALRKTRQQDA